MQNKQKGQMVFWIAIIILVVLVVAYKVDLAGLRKGKVSLEEDKVENKIENKIESKSYTVPGKFSFSYNGSAEIYVPPLINEPSLDAEGIRVKSGNIEEYISHYKNGSQLNPEGDMGVSFVKDQFFGNNLYKVYKIEEDNYAPPNPPKTLGFYYLLNIENGEAIFINSRHDSNIPMLIDLSSVKLN